MRQTHLENKNAATNITNAAHIKPTRFFMAVSYTHLDVYKRQVWGLSDTIAIFWPIRALSSVDLPTFVLPATAINPDLNLSFICLNPFC